MNRPVMKIVSLILSTEQETATGDTHSISFKHNLGPTKSDPALFSYQQATRFTN